MGDFLGDESFARDAAHRRENALVLDAAGRELVLDHGGAESGEIGRHYFSSNLKASRTF